MPLPKEAIELVGNVTDIDGLMHDFKAHLSSQITEIEDRIELRDIPVKRLGEVSGINHVWPEDF